METEWGGPLRILFWAILAIVLFRFWPVTAADEPAQDAPVTSREPAV
jgi:hypothetical protein